MIIRSAAVRDAAAIAEIWNGVIRDTAITFASDTRTVPQIARMIGAGSCFLVAEADGQTVGFSTWTQFRAGSGYAHSIEHTIHVAEAFRARGIGRALLEDTAERAARDGAHVLVACVSSENPGGQAFHRACGFVQCGRLPGVGRKFGRWLDLILLTRTLRPA